MSSTHTGGCLSFPENLTVAGKEKSILFAEGWTGPSNICMLLNNPENNNGYKNKVMTCSFLHAWL